MTTVHMAGMGVLPETQHINLSVDEGKHKWYIELNPATGKGCRISFSNLTAAGNVMSILEEAVNSGEITEIKEF